MNGYTIYADHPVDGSGKGDPVFIVSVMLLWGLGIYTLYSCTQGIGQRFFGSEWYFFIRQLLWSGLGFIGCIFFATAPMEIIRKMIFPVTVISFILCLITVTPLGLHRNGASRWLKIPLIGAFQPSEIVKLTIVLYLANMFDSHQDEYLRAKGEYIYPLLVLLLFTFVIAGQRDMSTSLFVFGLGCVVFFISGTTMSWIIPLTTLAVPGALILIGTEKYRIDRIIAFLSPAEHTHDVGFQANKSINAIAAGGIWGVGSGGVQDAISGLPEVQTDYIFSGWSASMGLLGVTGYFLLLVIFAWKGFSISVKCQNRFAAIASFCFVFAILFQSLINCAVVVGVLPTTGIPLPFFSSGGSSMIITLCMCGFILNASRCDTDKEKREQKSEDTGDESFMGVVVEYE